MAAVSGGLILTMAAGAGAMGAGRNQVRKQKQGAKTQMRGQLAQLKNRPGIPTIDSKAVDQARLGKLQDLQKRSGMTSTNLSQNFNNTFGG